MCLSFVFMTQPNTAAAETPAAESSSASTPVPAPASSHGRQPLIKFRHGDREAIAAELLRKSQTVAQPPPPPRATTADDTTTASAATGAAFTDIPASNMRKIIASRLAESKSTIPHFYVSQECDITELTALRKSLATVTKVSVNDFVIRASVRHAWCTPSCRNCGTPCIGVCHVLSGDFDCAGTSIA